jgi:hypothetical protein
MLSEQSHLPAWLRYKFTYLIQVYTRRWQEMDGDCNLAEEWQKRNNEHHSVPRDSSASMSEFLSPWLLDYLYIQVCWHRVSHRKNALRKYDKRFINLNIRETEMRVGFYA